MKNCLNSSFSILALKAIQLRAPPILCVNGLVNVMQNGIVFIVA
jgi:hypothetical protein